MATKPVPLQDPASSHDEQVSESWMLEEAGTCHKSSLYDKKMAPTAVPEEDLDVCETEGPDEMTELVKEALQAHEESEDFMNLIGQDAFPPPPPLGVLSTEECVEKEYFSSLEREVTEWISELISDPTDNSTSPDSQTTQEWPQTPQLIEPSDSQVDSTSEEMMGDTIGNSTEPNSSGDIFRNSETHSADRNSPHYQADVYTVCSPPFADESEEEEEQEHRGGTISSDPTSSHPAVLTLMQQGALLSQDHTEPDPRGENQEAAQQVLSQSSAPLSTVAIELSDQGGAASQSSGCVVAVRKRHSRAEGQTEGETGGEEGERESGGSEVAGPELVIYSRIQEKKTESVSCQHMRPIRMESDWCDDSDSGVSADFSPCSTLDTNVSTGAQAAPPKETPIEREIRRAIEREQSLRRSRGLPNPPKSPEYVEIPLRKTVLCQALPFKSERCQGKDREFAGKKMQHEIHEEAQREQALVKLGRVPGFYDKGTVRQLKERKQLFEAFQKPSDSETSKPWSPVSGISTAENQEDISSQVPSETRYSIGPSQNAKKGSSTSSKPRGPGVSEGRSSQVIILENNLSVPAQKLYLSKLEADSGTPVNSGCPRTPPSRAGGHGGVTETDQEMHKENPFFKLRCSTNLVKVEQDIREAQEREMELRKQRISLYGGARELGCGGGRRASMDGQKSSSVPLNGLTVPDLPGSSSRRGSGSTTVRQSHGRVSVWPPAQPEEEEMNQPEALQSPHTPRRRTPLVHHWESGLVNRHNED